MSEVANLQYIHDADGKPVGVIVPIDVWHEVESERETAYLLNSAAMKERLLTAKGRSEGVSLEDARAKLGHVRIERKITSAIRKAGGEEH